jgi:uncharacterized protein
MSRQLSLLAGFSFLGIGIIGAFLPVLPSTCFFICAAYYFAKSSARMEHWILKHPRFGPTVVAWRETRSIPKSGKIAAILGMSISAFILYFSHPPFYVFIAGIIALVISALYVLTRPTLPS